MAMHRWSIALRTAAPSIISIISTRWQLGVQPPRASNRLFVATDSAGSHAPHVALRAAVWNRAPKGRGRTRCTAAADPGCGPRPRPLRCTAQQAAANPGIWGLGGGGREQLPLRKQRSVPKGMRGNQRRRDEPSVSQTWARANARARHGLESR